MLLELMSNGTLAELPPENLPENIAVPEEPSVMLLLPHNKYLLGTVRDKWIYSDYKPGAEPRDVFLYDDEGLSLTNEGTQPIILPPVTVNALRKELLHLTEPPGRHASTVLLLRTFMRNNPAFASKDADFLDEKIFTGYMRKDLTLCKAYWTLRFALARGEMETVSRIKAWLRAEPENFTKDKNKMRIWFTLQDMPAEEILSEMEELSFSRLEINRMSVQKTSPVVLYNPVSGWLVLGRMGNERKMVFLAWVYFTPELWDVLRERKKMPVRDIILAAWGEDDTQQAMIERAKYKGAEITE